jgi:hypothetical protein
MQEAGGIVLNCADYIREVCEGWLNPVIQESCDLPTQPADPQSRARSTEQEVGGLSDIRTREADGGIHRNGRTYPLRR